MVMLVEPPSPPQSCQSVDPEEEAFKALKNAICRKCKKNNITSKDDVRLQKLVAKYNDKFPSLTAEVIEEEVRLRATADGGGPTMPTLPTTLEFVADDSYRSGNQTEETSPGNQTEETTNNNDFALPPNISRNPSMSSGGSAAYPSVMMDVNEDFDSAGKVMTITYDQPVDNTSDIDRDDNNESEATPPKKPSSFTTFKTKCKENSGYNLLTYTFLLSTIMILTFLTSVIFTYVNYNHGPYRDWALAGGVTSTSAKFRVRGPSSDDGFRREFVVSTIPNLSIERYHILNVPVSYGDFMEEEHFVKRVEISDLKSLTPYYYGITRPKRTPNSAEVAGNVGTFTTPAPEGTRMDFTFATGSCALTGSKSDMFANILDLDPLLFIHMGDLHYEDLNTLDIDERLSAYDKVMGSPTQRLLYTRTIFSYIWDDHDWLGNNQDSDDEEAAAVAKRAYTLGIPHYELGSSSSTRDEDVAPKYQAYTIGTVRFIITDLRSESIKSSEYYSGKVYSKEQKRWLFNELSQAANYDFVVWVTTRPWTDPVKVGSDSWGGFVAERDELSKHIANTIGAGPRNLLVISGDNHMVAFDDGSSTDYSGQDSYPGGFPLLHSGPMTNYGSGLVDFFSPSTNYFTDGCMATNSELNYQFSTVSFSFNRGACVKLTSYSKDTSNIIFEKEMCGDLMRYGTSEKDTCTLKKLTIPTQSLFIAAAGLTVLSGVLALWFMGLKGCQIALSYFGLGVLYYLLTIAAAIAGAFCFGTLGVNMVAVSAFVLAQSLLASLFVGKAIFGYCSKGSKDNDDVKITDAKAIEIDEEDAHDDGNVKNDVDEDGAAAHDKTQSLLGSLFVGKAIFGYFGKGSKDNDDVKITDAKAIEIDEEDAHDDGDDKNDVDEDGAATHDSIDDVLGPTAALIAGGAIAAKSDSRENTDLSSPETTAAVLYNSQSGFNSNEGEKSVITPPATISAKISNTDSKKSTVSTLPALATTIVRVGTAPRRLNSSIPDTDERAIVKQKSSENTDIAVSETRSSTNFENATAENDDLSTHPVLCGRSMSDVGRNVNSSSEGMAAVFSSAKSSSLPMVQEGKAFGRSQSMKYNKSPRLEERVAAVLSGVSFFSQADKDTPKEECYTPKEECWTPKEEWVEEETEEGIEVTSPTSKTSPAYRDIRVSPTLTEL